MFLEFLSHAISFDWVWIVELVLNNLAWVFVLAAFAFINHDGKHWFWAFIFLVGLLWVFGDFIRYLGWLMVPFVLFIPLQMAMMTFFKGTRLQKRELPIIVIVFFALAFVFTYFVG